MPSFLHQKGDIVSFGLLYGFDGGNQSIHHCLVSWFCLRL